MNSRDLTIILASTNNGYLFAPTATELACARANPDCFDITANGTIKPKGFAMPRYPLMRAPVSHSRCDFDYEGAILARQENSGIFD
jgi:hypothetical protein